MAHEFNAVEVDTWVWIFDVSRGLVTARTRSSWTKSWYLNQVKEQINKHSVYENENAKMKIAYLSCE